MITRLEPMCAATATEDEIKVRMNNPNWIAEEKFDGSRYMLHLENEGNRLFSRNISTVTNMPIDRAGNVPHITGKIYKELNGTVLDGEIISSNLNFGNVATIMGSGIEKSLAWQAVNGKGIYKVFDVLYYKGEDVKNHLLASRRLILEKIVKELNIPEVQIVKWVTTNKEDYYKQIILTPSGEGIILKDLNGIYVSEYDYRDKDIWVKVKKVKTYDVVIMGFTQPEEFSTNSKGVQVINKHFANKQIAAVEFGVYKEGVLTKVGQAAGINDKQRKFFSDNVDKLIGKVVEVKGNGVLKDAIRHPRFIRERFDLDPTQCTYEKFKSVDGIK